MGKKRKQKSFRNCKDGLTSKQEFLARQIRKDLLDDNKKHSHYDSIICFWLEFCKLNKNKISENEFINYLELKSPELYSAFKRLNVDIIEIVKSVEI